MLPLLGRGDIKPATVNGDVKALRTKECGCIAERCCQDHNNPCYRGRPLPIVPKECEPAGGQIPLMCDMTDMRPGYTVFRDKTLHIRTPSDGWRVCGPDMIGLLDGGELKLNSINNTSTGVSIDLSIVVPMSAMLPAAYNATIYLCNDQGEMICYDLVYWLNCGGGDRPAGRSLSRISTYDISPNPASTEVMVSYSDLADAELCEISFYTLQGQLVQSAEVSKVSPTTDIQSLPNGVYIVTVREEGDTELHVQRLVVLHE